VAACPDEASGFDLPVVEGDQAGDGGDLVVRLVVGPCHVLEPFRGGVHGVVPAGGALVRARGLGPRGFELRHHDVVLGEVDAWWQPGLEQQGGAVAVGDDLPTDPDHDVSIGPDGITTVVGIAGVDADAFGLLPPLVDRVPAEREYPAKGGASGSGSG
jgi:hypothetical protein